MLISENPSTQTKFKIAIPINAEEMKLNIQYNIVFIFRHLTRKITVIEKSLQTTFSYPRACQRSSFVSPFHPDLTPTT